VANARKRKRAADDFTTSASNHEEEIKRIAGQLSEKHGDLWDRKQYLLWARMYVNIQWTSLDKEPDIHVPLLRGGLKKVPKEESISEAIAGAAIAFAKTLSVPSTPSSSIPTPSKPLPDGVSPASKAKLSSAYISQLRELQELRENGVLSEEEFQEQKRFALNNIRGMNK
jgi:hypothetical protein